MRTAVIGIGSNSLRMLLADIENGELHRAGRYREGLRIFAALNERGEISSEMTERACQKVRMFVEEAKCKGAETVHLFATSAVRDAKNQRQFADAMEKATALKLEICSGEMEARLSYIGATGGGTSGLIDIGGGSTEIAVGRNAEIARAESLQMGAVRLFRLQPIVDLQSAQKVVCMAGQTLAPVLAGFQPFRAQEWVGVGGTFTTAAALVQKIPWNNRASIHGYSLTLQAVESTLALLAPMPLKERLALKSLQPQRADIVVHGVAILLACMTGLGIPSITVSEYGNLEGFLKAKYLYSSRAAAADASP